MINLPVKVEKLLGILEANGHEAFIVGGCVRDSLINRTPDDWDICTSARPDEIIESFKDFHVIETGLQHGTVTVLVENEAFEITTYRIDGDYSDGRHPDRVTFTSQISEDLSRRDFTINAMAYNPLTGLIDPFNGQDDLETGIIRCVGDPATRFSEDSLRILRAVRFASQLDYLIENSTIHAMYECLSLLNRVAAERIRVEFEKLLCGQAAFRILSEHREIIAEFIPEIIPMFDLYQHNNYHIYDVWTHTLHTVAQIPAIPVLRLTAFFHDIGKPGTMTITEENWGHFYGHERHGAEITNDILSRLRYDNHTRETITTVIDAHKIVFQPTEKHARRCLNKLGEDRLRMLIDLELSDVKSQNPEYTSERVERILTFAEKVDKVITAAQCFSLKHLDISGHDLIEAGIPQGPEIGRIMNLLLEQVIEGNLPNSKSALLKEAINSFDFSSMA